MFKLVNNIFRFFSKAKKSTLVLDNTIAEYSDASNGTKPFYPTNSNSQFPYETEPLIKFNDLKSYAIDSQVSSVNLSNLNFSSSNLDFSNSSLGSSDSGIKDLFIKKLKGNKSVYYLNLANNNIGDYDACTISSNLKYNNIAYLNLENNKFTNYGMGAVIRGLKDSNIISLKFGDVKMQDKDDDYHEEIAEIIKKLLEYQFITEITLPSLDTDCMQKINAHIEHNKQTLCNAQKIVKIFKEHPNIKEVNIQLFNKKDLEAFKLYSDHGKMNIVWNLDEDLMTISKEDRAMIEQKIITFSNTPHLWNSESLSHKIESEEITEKHAISSKKQKVVTFSDPLVTHTIEYHSDTSLSGETLDTDCVDSYS